MDLLTRKTPTPLTPLIDEVLISAGVSVFVKRDDLIHPFVSGNKWRKLKYNLLEACQQGYDSLLTFGGAYSNHLYAVAAAGAALGFKTTGIVRGEEHSGHESPTILYCMKQGMEICYVSRQEYKFRNQAIYLEEVVRQHGNPYLIPEGGTNALALKGVAEMIIETREQLGREPDYFAVAAGTGGTTAGILYAGARVAAFSALKGGGFLETDVSALLKDSPSAGTTELFTDYHFGGYAKWNHELLEFIRKFRLTHDIQLEQVYTGKMFYGLYDLIRKHYFPRGTTIVAVHTGGLQGLLPTLSGD